MSFIQWAVLTVIGLFTLTFCIFTIMDRILKHKETKFDKVDHSYLRDEINDLCNRIANLEDRQEEQLTRCDEIVIAADKDIDNVRKDVDKLKKEMRDMVHEMDVKVEGFGNETTNQFNAYKIIVDKELDDILAQLNDLADETTNRFSNFKNAIDADFDKIYKQLNKN